MSTKSMLVSTFNLPLQFMVFLASIYLLSYHAALIAWYERANFSCSRTTAHGFMVFLASLYNLPYHAATVAWYERANSSCPRTTAHQPMVFLVSLYLLPYHSAPAHGIFNQSILPVPP